MKIVTQRLIILLTTEYDIGKKSSKLAKYDKTTLSVKEWFIISK